MRPVVGKKDFEGGLLGESGEVDRRCGGNKFEVASDGRAADSCEGAAEDEFEGFSSIFGFRKSCLR